MANVAPTETVLTVYETTLDDSGTSPDPDTVGCNAVWHEAVTGDVAAGYIFPNTGREQVVIQSTATGQITVTVDCPNACNQGYTTTHDKTSHIAIGSVTPQVKLLGTYSKHRWSDGTTFGSGTLAVTNYVKFTVSAYTGVKIMVVRTPI